MHAKPPLPSSEGLAGEWLRSLDCHPALQRCPMLEGCGQQRHLLAAFHCGLVNPRTGAISTRCLYPSSCCSSWGAWMPLGILCSWLPLMSCGGPCHPMAAPASRHFGKLGVGAGFQVEEDQALRPGSAQDLDVHLSRL